MGAPMRIIVGVGAIKMSAFYLGEVAPEQVDKLVCKSCAPARTKMKFRGQVMIPTPKGEWFYYIYACQACERCWATGYIMSADQKVGE